ncbi:MAG: putative toxin-antitoxin system toxin component, PIN family [Acidimicrobiia bacterium]
MLRAVVDPNVLVSAAITPAGTVSRVVSRAFARRFVVCPHLLAELEEVLHRPAFRQYITVEDVGELVEAVARVGEPHEDPEVISASRDPKDDYLIALAAQAQVDRLVTGDGYLHAVPDPPCTVVTPRGRCN